MKYIYTSAAFGLALALIIGFVTADQVPQAIPKFYEGQLVSPVLNDRLGMIIDSTCWSGEGAICWYVVRYDVPGGAAVRVNNVREYELKEVYP